MLKIREVDSEELPMGLLLLADPSEQRIRRYLIGAHAFVGVNNAVPVSVLVMRWRNADEAEIMNVAVALGASAHRHRARHDGVCRGSTPKCAARPGFRWVPATRAWAS